MHELVQQQPIRGGQQIRVLPSYATKHQFQKNQFPCIARKAFCRDTTYGKCIGRQSGMCEGGTHLGGDDDGLDIGDVCLQADLRLEEYGVEDAAELVGAELVDTVVGGEKLKHLRSTQSSPPPNNVSGKMRQ